MPDLPQGWDRSWWCWEPGCGARGCHLPGIGILDALRQHQEAHHPAGNPPTPMADVTAEHLRLAERALSRARLASTADAVADVAQAIANAEERAHIAGLREGFRAATSIAHNRHDLRRTNAD
jgi:hypothetical protein